MVYQQSDVLIFGINPYTEGWLPYLGNKWYNVFLHMKYNFMCCSTDAGIMDSDHVDYNLISLVTLSSCDSCCTYCCH